MVSKDEIRNHYLNRRVPVSGTLLLLFLLACTSLSAQISLTQFSPQSQAFITLNELHNIVINNQGTETYKIAIRCHISDSAGADVLDYSFKTQTTPGVKPCQFLKADTNALSIYQASLRDYFYKYAQLPAGKYKLCYTGEIRYSKIVVAPFCMNKTAKGAGISLKSPSLDTAQWKKLGRPLPKNNYKIDSSRFKISDRFKAPSFEEELKPPKINTDSILEARKERYKKIKEELKKPDPKFGGQATVSYTHHSSQTTTNLYPSSFYTAEITPHFSLYSLPARARLFVSTNYKGDLFIQQFSVELDRRQFQEGLKQRLYRIQGIDKPKLPSLPSYSAGGFGFSVPTNLGTLPSLSAPGPIPYDPSQFTGADRALLQKYRYDKESLLRYKDSLDWTDPRKAGQLQKLIEQTEFQNTMQLLEQQNNTEKIAAFEDSLLKKNPESYLKMKDYQSSALVQQIQAGHWPDKPGKLAAVMPMSRAEKAIYNVQHFSIGKSYLNYTPNSIMGVSVTGVDGAYTPGKFYVQGSAGFLDMKESLWFQKELAQKYRVMGTRTGYGLPDATHFHLIYLDFNKNGAVQNDTLTHTMIPLHNTLAGAEWAVAVKSFLLYRMEYLRSFNTFQSGLTNEYTLFAKEDTLKKDPLSHDAINASCQLRPGMNSTLTVDANRIGSDYHTLGNPYLRNDLFNYGAQATQGLFHQMLSLHAGYREEVNNLQKQGDVTERSRRYESGGTLGLKNGLLLNLHYLPVFFFRKQRNETDYAEYSSSRNLMFSVSQHWLIKGKQLTGTGLLSRLINDNRLMNRKIDIYTYMAQSMLQYTRTTSFRVMGSYSKPAVGSDTFKVIMIDLSVSAQPKKWLQQTAGIRASKDVYGLLPYLYSKSSALIGKNYIASMYLYYCVAPKTPQQGSNNMVQLSFSATF